MDVRTHRITAQFSGVLGPVTAPAMEAASLRPPPLRCAEDFSSMLAFEHEPAAPVRLSHATYYALMADLVTQLSQGWRDATVILIRYSAPCLTRIPERLLAGDVFLSAQPHLCTGLMSGSTRHLVISDRFRRDATERGDNRIELSLFNDANAESFADAVRRSMLYRFLSPAIFNEALHDTAGH